MPAHQPDAEDALDLDALLDHPYHEPLEEALDTLVRALPTTSPRCQRTTILSWLYLENGVLTFLDLTERIQEPINITARKKSVRQVLRGLEKLHLVSIVNFPNPEEEEGIDNDGVIGRMSMVSLTWSGMIWLRRAWSARAKIMGRAFSQCTHDSFIEEEDDGKGNDPYWVENISGADPEMLAMAARASGADKPQGSKKTEPITSIFGLGARRIP